MNYRFIAVEGMDGSGKSTVTKLLGELFGKHGIEHKLTYEVGGTPIGKEIRQMAFSRNESGEVLNPTARLLMIAASRIQHVENVIKPHLANGEYVITDRYEISSRVYQGILDGQSEVMDLLEQSELECLELPRPAYVVYLTGDPEVFYRRGKERAVVDNDQYKSSLEQAKAIGAAYESAVFEDHAVYSTTVFCVRTDTTPEEVEDQLIQVFEQIIDIDNGNRSPGYIWNMAE